MMDALEVVRHHNSVLRRSTRRAWDLEAKLARVLEPILVAAGEEAARTFEEHAVDFLAAAAAQGAVEAAESRSEPIAGSVPGLTSLSTMIAVSPRESEAAALEHAGHEGATPAGELHVTLAYLGDYDGDLEQLAALLRPLAGEHAPMTGEVAGIGAFKSKPDGPRPNIMLPSVRGLAELRVAVTVALATNEVEYSRDYGWVPHMTAGYSEDDSMFPSLHVLGQEVHFDHLEIWRANDERILIPLTGTTPITAAAQWSKPPSNKLVNVDKLVSTLRTKTDPVRQAVVETTMKAALDKHGIAYDVTNPGTEKVLAQSGSQIVNIAETTQLNVTRIIKASYDEGLTIPDTAKAIRAGMKEASVARATLIARTELVGAVNGGSLAASSIVSDATGIAMDKQWLTAPGAPFPRHELYDGLNGQTQPLDGYFAVGADQLSFPGDPTGSPEEVCNCFPGSTSVVAFGLEMGFRRRYDGDLVRVEVFGVGDLSGTPNHPVLTDTGWKPLGALREGDHLVCAVPRQDERAVDPNVDHGPTAIHQVFSTLASRVASSRVRGRAVQFHGDASADGEVEVVAADGYLRSRLDAAEREKVSEFDLTWAGETSRGLAPKSPGFNLIVAGGDEAASSMSVRGEEETFGLRESAHSLSHGGRPTSRNDAGLTKPSVYDIPADAVMLGERLYGDSCVVSLGEVVAVERNAFHGEVFNLQTESGTYLANHIVVHNCRCTIIYTESGQVVAQGDAEEQLAPEDAAAAAEEDAADSQGGADDAGSAIFAPPVEEAAPAVAHDETAVFIAPPIVNPEVATVSADRPYQHWAKSTLDRQIVKSRSIVRNALEKEQSGQTLTDREAKLAAAHKEKLEVLLRERNARKAIVGQQDVETAAVTKGETLTMPINQRMDLMRGWYADRTARAEEMHLRAKGFTPDGRAWQDNFMQNVKAIGAMAFEEVETRLEGSLGASFIGARREAIKSLMNEVRDVGTRGMNDHTFKLTTSQAKNETAAAIQATVMRAAEWYPREWLDELPKDGRGVNFKQSARGYFDRADELLGTKNHTLSISTESRSKVTADPPGYSVAIHEIAHYMEERIAGIKEAEAAFYRARTAGEESVPYKNGEAHEMVKPDEFVNEYMGKDYGQHDVATEYQSYELLSMGMESIFTGSFDVWERDPEMRNFILGLLLSV